MPFLIRNPGSATATIVEESDLPQRISGLPAGVYEVGRASIDWAPQAVTITETATPPAGPEVSFEIDYEDGMVLVEWASTVPGTITIDIDGIGALTGSLSPLFFDLPGDGVYAWSAVVSAGGLSSLPTVGQLAVAVPAETPYYPDIPAVSMTAPGGSSMLPEHNYASSAPWAATQKGAYYQSISGMYFQPGTVKQAWIAVIRLPRDKRQGGSSTFLPLFGHQGTGGKKFWLRYNANAYNSAAARNRFQAYFSGNGGVALQNVLSAPWTEDEALVVLWCDGAGNWQIDWYSTKDGTVHAGTAANGGTPVTAATAAFTADSGPTINIGGNGDLTAYTANSGSLMWPGEIEMVGILAGNTTPLDQATWSSLALGGDIKTLLPVTPVKWLRRFDGVGPAKDPHWTYDTLSDAALIGSGATGIPASTVRPGSMIRRQAAARYLRLDGISHGLVYDLAPGASQRDVLFVGEGAGFSGDVEVQVYETATGVIVRDWTSLGAVSGGRFSGTVSLPKGNAQWWRARVRAAADHSLIGLRADDFSVGYVVMLLGQSQVSIALNNGPFAGTLLSPGLTSFMSNDGSEVAGFDLLYLQMGRVGLTGGSTQSRIAFVNQLRAFDATTPLLIIDEAVNGTGMAMLVEGTGATSQANTRSWSPQLTDKLTRHGIGLSAVVHQWGTTDANVADLGALIEAMLFGTGARGTTRSIRALDPEVAIALSPLTRHSYPTLSAMGNTSTARSRALSWANPRSDVAVGPPTSDFYILSDANEKNGPHPDPSQTMGGPMLMARMAVAAARALGLDTSRNSYWGNARYLGNKLRIAPVLLNGGELTSPAPSALRNWQVDDGGSGTWSSTGFTAAIINGEVEITKASGTWSAGSRVRLLDQGEPRPDQDGATEGLINAGWCYETWPADVLGRGMPVLGSLSGGKWIATYEKTAVEATVPFDQGGQVTLASRDGLIAWFLTGVSDWKRAPNGQLSIKAVAGQDITLLAVDPPATQDAQGRWMHGLMRNAAPGAGQALDERAMESTSIKRLGHFSSDLMASLPLTLAAGDVLLKACGRPVDYPGAGEVQRGGMLREVASLAVVDQLPDQWQFPPSPWIWTGKSAAARLHQAYDVGQIAAGLPSYPVTGVTNAPTAEEVLSAVERYNPCYGLTRATANDRGYESLSVIGSTWGTAGSVDAAYGVNVRKTMAEAGVNAVTDRWSLAQKERWVAAMIDRGVCWDMPHLPIIPDGGHHQFHLWPIVLKRVWGGESLQDLITSQAGNTLGQYFIHDAATIAMMQPHNDDTYFVHSRRRQVQEINVGGDPDVIRLPVMPNAGDQADGRIVLEGFFCVGPAGRGIVSSHQSLKIDSSRSYPSSANFRLVDWTGTPLAVSDYVFFESQYAFQIGDPDWSLWGMRVDAGRSDRRRYYPRYRSMENYRELNRERAFHDVMHALGLWQDAWIALKTYIARASSGDYPMDPAAMAGAQLQGGTWTGKAIFPYGDHVSGYATGWGNSNLVQRFAQQHGATVLALPQDGAL